MLARSPRCLNARGYLWAGDSNCSFRGGGGAYRDIGTWDPLALPRYALAGKAAQKAFWEPDPPALSMLAQLARVAGRDG